MRRPVSYCWFCLKGQSTIADNFDFFWSLFGVCLCPFCNIPCYSSAVCNSHFLFSQVSVNIEERYSNPVYKMYLSLK